MGEDKLQSHGFAVLPFAVDAPTVAEMRDLVCANLGRMANTRPNPASRHIAGFHRLPVLEPLHSKLTENPALNCALSEFYANRDYVTIGLSDITVNRSQPWHTDLLRGAYARYLTPEMCWGHGAVGCLKALLYLQDGKSLRVIPGSHLQPVSLADDSGVVPTDPKEVTEVAVQVGDIVLMDIRLVHRGSTEAEMAQADLVDAPKILLSTVFGEKDAPLTLAMEYGNAQRMRDWDAAHPAANIVV